MLIIAFVLTFILSALLVATIAYMRKVNNDLNEIYSVTSFSNRLADHVEAILKDDSLTIGEKFKITYFG